MKKRLVWLALLLLTTAAEASAQRKFNVYAVGFYNLENLFDTCHDVGKNDFEYLPDKGWNALKYSHKLRNMARVLADMGSDVLPPSVGCAAIGVSEVENAKALTDLCNQEPLKARNMQFAHVEGPDRRGIDCALIYNPKLFAVENVCLHPYVQALEKDSGYCTRGFLEVSGRMADEPVTIIVNHLPSRFQGSFYREQGAKQLRHIKDSLLADDPKRKVMIMGDMNDDPTDRSMAVELRGRREIKEVEEGDMYNPWWNVLAKEGKGTLMYNGSWNLFDQILLTPNLLDRKGRKDYRELTYLKHNVFRRDYLLQQDGKYKGNPLRTKAGGVWLDGFSDHLPVVVYLVKEVGR